MSTETALQKETRIYYWDNIKGFLILLVVFAHILYQLQDISKGIDATVNGIYLFHMPAFVFVSGYFGKSENSRSFKGIIKWVFLFYIFNSITVFIRYRHGFTSLTEPIFSYWYLIALVVWRLTAHHIAKFRTINIILFAVSLFIGFFPSIDNHFAVARTIGFYPFYMMGYKLSETESSNLIKKGFLERLCTGIAFLLCSALLALGTTVILGFPDGIFKLEPYIDLSDLLRRFVFYSVAFLAIFALRLLTPDRKIPLITMFGRNSLYIFILHRLFTIWLSQLICSFPVPAIFAISVLGTMVLCSAFGNNLVAGIISRFVSSGTSIFSNEEKKLNVSIIVAIAVAVGFIVLALIRAFSDMF